MKSSARGTRRRAACVATVATSLCVSALALGRPGGDALLNSDATVNVSSIAYKGLCDASAAVALSPTQFVVANDEDNVLRLFTVGQPTHVGSLDLGTHLAVKGEADIEGAARIGDRMYWITSHGRNKDGKFQPRRQHLFATRVTSQGAAPLTFEGTAYSGLLVAFLEPLLKEHGFTAAPDTPADPAMAPEQPGSLNIEGLAASGDTLLIGFRNPQPVVDGSRRALVVELLNPSELIKSSPATPKRGRVFRLDLGGRSIRSLEALPGGSGFLIVGGPVGDEGTFALYRWDGTQENPPVNLTGADFGDFVPEALFAPSSAPGLPSSLIALSDDGGMKLEDGIACKDAPPTRWRTRLANIAVK